MVRSEREVGTYTQYSIASRPRTTGEPPSTVPPKGKLVPFGKVRPQIFLAILCLTVLAIIAAFKGMPETIDLRNSHSIELAKKLIKKNHKVKLYDVMYRELKKLGYVLINLFEISIGFFKVKISKKFS